MKTKPRTKKRNPQDLTLRNLRALKKRVDTLAELKRRVEKLEAAIKGMFARDVNRWLKANPAPKRKGTKK